MSSKKLIKCAIYDRVSTEEQALYGISLATQVEDLTRYATDHGYEIVGYYSDEGITARKKLENREGFQRLLSDVKKDKIDLILVTKLDRWFRNVRDYHNTQAILEAHHCNWKTIYEDYDTSTADGQLKINIMLAVAQNECDRTSERIKVVFAHKFRNREHITGAAPYGYILVNKKLEKDPQREHIVNEIFEHYFKTFSKRDTIFHIMEKYKDDEKLSIYKINRVLGNESYCGRYNGISGYHPAYITEQQYQQIKTISSSKTYAFTDGTYIFSGLLKCPVCKNNLSGFVKRNKLKDGSYSIYRRYRCCAKLTRHKGSPCITEHIIESYMIEHLWPELQRCIYEAKQAAPAEKIDKTPKIKAEMDRLNILFQKGRISDEYYDSQFEKLEKELKQLQFEQKIDKEKAYKEIEKKLQGNWEDIYNQLDLKHKQIFWKRIIKEIHIDPKTNKICGFSFLI